MRLLGFMPKGKSSPVNLKTRKIKAGMSMCTWRSIICFSQYAMEGLITPVQYKYLVQFVRWSSKCCGPLSKSDLQTLQEKVGYIISEGKKIVGKKWENRPTTHGMCSVFGDFEKFLCNQTLLATVTFLCILEGLWALVNRTLVAFRNGNLVKTDAFEKNHKKNRANGTWPYHMQLSPS